MKLSTREDIEAPIEAVFAMLTRFEDFERAAMRRGAEVRRRREAGPGPLGTAWDVRFVFNGKQRDVALEVTRCEAPGELVVGMQSSNITGDITCELFALSRSRTRMTLAVEARPLTLSARLLIQSLRLTKSSLTDKFKARVRTLVTQIEARCRGEG